MDIETVIVPRRLVTGHVVRTSKTDETDQQRARLPGLWRRAAVGGDMMSILTDYESHGVGKYTQLVGREIHKISSVGRLSSRPTWTRRTYE
jgi:hypothetical protein